MIRRRVRWNDDEGAVLVEFAIVMPILLLIVWCIIDFARAYYTVNSLATAVREGARYAAVQQNPTVSKPQVDSVVMKAFNAFGGSPIAASQINLFDSSGVAAKGNVTVQVTNYWWIPSTPFINLITGDSINMTRQSTFRWERSWIP